MHSKNPDVIRMANTIKRTPNAIAIRLGNYAFVDESLPQKGLENGYRQVSPIWQEFLHDRDTLIFESERILAEKENQQIESKYKNDLLDVQNLVGETKVRAIKIRVNQHIFRQMVLVNYGNRCAITGINISSLLIASHIVPWSENEKERLNPENGICLSPLYDRAFDQGLIGITPDLELRVSEKLNAFSKEPFHQKHFASIHGQKIREAEKYRPRRDFLEWHWEKFFVS